jgi:hypothetical protein
MMRCGWAAPRHVRPAARGDKDVCMWLPPNVASEDPDSSRGLSRPLLPLSPARCCTLATPPHEPTSHLPVPPHQSTNQPTNHPTSQPTNQPTNQLTTHPSTPQIGVTQPRRVAAVSTATRVALELGGPLGSLVGYQV